MLTGKVLWLTPATNSRPILKAPVKIIKSRKIYALAAEEGKLLFLLIHSPNSTKLRWLPSFPRYWQNSELKKRHQKQTPEALLWFFSCCCFSIQRGLKHSSESVSLQALHCIGSHFKGYLYNRRVKNWSFKANISSFMDGASAHEKFHCLTTGNKHILFLSFCSLAPASHPHFFFLFVRQRQP